MTFSKYCHKSLSRSSHFRYKHPKRYQSTDLNPYKGTTSTPVTFMGKCPPRFKYSWKRAVSTVDKHVRLCVIEFYMCNLPPQKLGQIQRWFVGTPKTKMTNFLANNYMLSFEKWRWWKDKNIDTGESFPGVIRPVDPIFEETKAHFLGHMANTTVTSDDLYSLLVLIIAISQEKSMFKIAKKRKCQRQIIYNYPSKRLKSPLHWPKF